MNKRSKTDYIELSDNLVDESSKLLHSRTNYCNKVKTRTTWENPIRNIQKGKKSVKSSQDGQTSGSSKKRKSFDDAETKLAEFIPKTESTVDRSSVTKFNDIGIGRIKLRACRRSKEIKEGTSADDNMRITLSETGVKSTRSGYGGNLDKKIISKSTTHVGNEKKKHVSINPETSKSISFTRVGPKQKLSAQSRLISKRKEFEAASKKALNSAAASNASNLLMEIEKQETVKVVQNVERKYTCSNSSSSSSCAGPVMTRVRNRVKRHLREYREKVTDSNESSSLNDENTMCLYEEMDWEPIEQEVMIEHIKKIRRDCANVEELSNDIAVCSSTDMETAQDEIDLILVFDTNVLISCLPFIKEIRDTCIPELGLPRIFIPWRALQELDHLKTSDIKPLQVSAIRAIRFLNENFSSRHPRVTGQSFEDRLSTEDSHSCPDDEILQICLHLKQKNQSKLVILITNDKNLESKAIVSGVEAFSKDRFVKEKLRDSKRNVSSGSVGSKTKIISMKSDMAYCRLKGALKKFLEQLLETEFVNAFNKDWKKIVVKKPPWMLMDMFECLIKHWRSVFNFIFKRDVLVLVEDLKELFEKVDKGEITVITDIAQVCKELLTRMTVFVGVEKPYSKILSETLAEVEMWSESKKPPIIENRVESQVTLPASPATSSSQEPPVKYNPQFDAILWKDKVKNLFQIIWDQVKAFFFRVSELAAANGMNNPEAVNEVKTQFPYVIRNVQELVEIVEKILSLGPEDTHQANQIILHFTNFLVGLNVFQIDSIELNNLPGYIGLFCGDNEGRVVLCALANDLKQFAMGMMDGMKVLEQL